MCHQTHECVVTELVQAASDYFKQVLIPIHQILMFRSRTSASYTDNLLVSAPPSLLGEGFECDPPLYPNLHLSWGFVGLSAVSGGAAATCV